MPFDLDEMAGRKPVEPTEPIVDPVDPDEPVEPTEPVEPVDPADPDEPAEPTEPDEPSEPEPDEDVDLSEVFIGDTPVSQMLEEREELAAKNQELQEKLGELESDPWLKTFLDVYKGGGDVEAYLSTKVDWDSKDDLTVLRKQFEKDNSDLDGSILDIAFKKEIKNKYGIDPLDEDIDTESDDYKMNQAFRKRDADKARKSFKEEQTKFSIPEKKEVKPVDNTEAFKKAVLGQDDVKAILKDKLLEVGVKSESGDSFKYELDNADPIVEMMWDEQKVWNLFMDPKTGKPDLKKAAKVFSYA